MDIALFACDKELFDDACKVLTRCFFALKGNASILSIMEIMQESMLYKLCISSRLGLCRSLSD